MKRFILLFVAACIFLVGCSSRSSSQTNQSSSTTVEKTTTEEVATTVEEIEKKEVYRYESDEGGVKQTIEETLIYKGDKFLKMELNITQEADEATKAKFSNLDFATVKSELLSYLERQTFMQQLRAVNGVEVSTDVTQDYSFVIHIGIDMATIDLQALSNVEGVGTDFTELTNITPSAYILGLKLRGAQKVE